MPVPRPVASRLKLAALFGVFLLPVALAWGMVEWRLGIPEARTAHGRLAPPLPVLAAWPLAGEGAAGGDWRLVFDCPADCAAEADRWWRLHRALGREAHRVSRLRIGGTGAPLPGASAVRWEAPPAWRAPGRVWLLDPDGRPALQYERDVATEQVLADLEHLLERNPAPPRAMQDD